MRGVTLKMRIQYTLPDVKRCDQELKRKVGKRFKNHHKENNRNLKFLYIQLGGVDLFTLSRDNGGTWR